MTYIKKIRHHIVFFPRAYSSFSPRYIFFSVKIEFSRPHRLHLCPDRRNSSPYIKFCRPHIEFLCPLTRTLMRIYTKIPPRTYRTALRAYIESRELPDDQSHGHHGHHACHLANAARPRTHTSAAPSLCSAHWRKCTLLLVHAYTHRYSYGTGQSRAAAPPRVIASSALLNCKYYMHVENLRQLALLNTLLIARPLEQ